MSISILPAANRIGERAGWTPNGLQMQMMIYTAHMLHLGETNGLPLIDGTFEAWDYGPVHPVLYHHTSKRYGPDPVPPEAFRNIERISSDHPGASILDDIVDKKIPRSRLVAITHWRRGAWAENYHPSYHALIPNRDIFDEYTLRMEHSIRRSKERIAPPRLHIVSSRSQASTPGPKHGENR